MRLILKIAILIFISGLTSSRVLSTNEPFDCSKIYCLDQIVIGKTNYNEALRLLRYYHGEDHVLEPRDQQNCRQELCSFEWFFKGTSDYGGTIITYENIVETAVVWYDHPRPTVADIQEQFGSPDDIFMTGGCDRIALIYNDPLQVIDVDVRETRVGVGSDQGIVSVFLGSAEDVLFGNIGLTMPWQGYINY